jgi:hypothetical protein
MIIDYTMDMEFGYDGKHGAYQAHVIRGPAVPPPPPAAAAATDPSAIAPASPPVRTPLAALESSRATARRGKKQNVLVRGLKTLISMCRSNDALIRESHQQMSHRLSTLEERQREMRASMGFKSASVRYPCVILHLELVLAVESLSSTIVTLGACLLDGKRLPLSYRLVW